MSSWREPHVWAKWVRADDCPICDRVSSGDAVAELEVTSLMMSEDAPMRGYAWLAFRRYVVELHELSDAEGAAFMRDIRQLSRAVAAAASPVKLNCEIHGNTVPHLHLHIFPRYVGDPFEGGPVNPRLIRHSVYESGEFARIRTNVLANLHDAAV